MPSEARPVLSLPQSGFYESVMLHWCFACSLDFPEPPSGQFQRRNRGKKIMRRTLSLLTLAGAFSVLALAENYSGKLLDASCYDQQKKEASCDASSATAAFAIDVSGKVFKLDQSGNTKAATALKNRADRTDPTKQQSKEVMAQVS